MTNNQSDNKPLLQREVGGIAFLMLLAAIVFVFLCVNAANKADDRSRQETQDYVDTLIEDRSWNQ